MPSTPIADYALIGDTETAALVSLAGSIDWLCLPRFDSPACFAALLGGPKHGRWLLTPVDDATTTRSYRGDSFVLETTHTTATGVVRVTDVMPAGDGRADIMRMVEGIVGRVEMRLEWIVRTDYGRIKPWVSRMTEHAIDNGVISAIAGPDMFVLRGTRLPLAQDGAHRDRFPVEKGQRYTFSMTWSPSHLPIPRPPDVPALIEETYRLSADWAASCTYEGPYRDAVVRSLLTLRMLTHSSLGGIVAAPTTSLPEDFGGVRNWDYRYCWLRDSALTLSAMLASGYTGSTELWRNWLVRAIAGDPEDMQIMYAVDGGRDLPETQLDHLPGYAGSRPVRIGNGAVDQVQTDVLGEVMVALEIARVKGLQESRQSWSVQRILMKHLASHWQEPDNGLWEIRGPLRHFTHSRVMVWAAFDRAIKAVELHGYTGPVGDWKKLRDQVRDEVLERGFNTAKNSFTQHYDTTEVDAS
ncbi:MAG: glycoside hydrolase family 15 protein, partial [Nostocoides sp.]